MSNTTYTPTATRLISPTKQRHSNGRSLDFKCTCPLPTATYEEVLQSSELFWEKLDSFHKSFGTKFKVPNVGGRTLDVDRLFVEVTSRGGLEKVYLFRKQVPPASIPDSFNGKFINGFASVDDGADMNQLLLPGRAELQLGSSVTGMIDGKFDDGYLITVSLGSNQFKGVLYHIPPVPPISENSHAINVHGAPRRHLRSSWLMLHDSSRLLYSPEASARWARDNYQQEDWALMEQPDQDQKTGVSGEKYQG